MYSIYTLNNMTNTKSINIVIIGLGHHAKRIYVDFKDQIKNVNLVGVVDLADNRENINEFLSKNNINVETFFITNKKTSDKLSINDEDRLNEFVKKINCHAVIISTEPLSHYKYIIWALKNNLHILLDKPITTEVNVSTDVNKAKKLFTDYKKIKSAYNKALKKKNIVFVLQAQRRFHQGFQYTKERIREIFNRTNCPVTSIQSFHSDGQWRLPDEISDIDYHSYNQNYGKMSHSGYHSLDISLWLCGIDLKSDKKYEKFEVYSKFSRPYDFLHQIRRDDYGYFFPEHKFKNTHKCFREDLKIEGEIDAFNSISLYNKDDALITHLSCSMLHNGFSQRGWCNPNMIDLYKGNGRVRHESYLIEQGPFQCIIINSFQSKEVLKNCDIKNAVGGENHFDVHVFRNSSLFKDCKPYELFHVKEDMKYNDYSYSRGNNEDARRKCIEEFIYSIKYNNPPELQKSNFFVHSLSTKILSAIYESGAKNLLNKNNIVKRKI